MTALAARATATELLAVPLAGITLAVTGDRAVLAALREITEPYYRPVTAAVGPAWRLDLAPFAPGQGGGPAEDGEPVHRAGFDVPGRRIIVRCDDARWLPLLGMRYVRTLTRALAIGAGAVPLHGAAVNLAGTGILLVGAKLAGKTTAALSLVRSGAGLVSNDDILLIRQSGGWLAAGGPRSVGVRTESLAEHRPPLVAGDLLAATSAHPGNRAGKRFLFPSAVAALGGAAELQAPARILIELVCVPGQPLRQRALTGPEAAVVLRAHLERAADRRRFELLDALAAAPPSLSPATIAALVRSLTFYRFAHPVSGWVDDLMTFARGVAVREPRDAARTGNTTA